MARLVSGRVPTVPVRRLRLRLPLRLSVFTLATFTPKIASTAWRISILLASGCDDERVDAGVEQRVGLLGDDRPDDDVAGVLHQASDPPRRRCRGRRVRPGGSSRERLSGRRAGVALVKTIQSLHEDVVGVELADVDQLDVGRLRKALTGRLVLGARRRAGPCRRGRGASRAADGVLGLGRRRSPSAVEDDDLALAGPVGQRRAQREPDHLLGGLLVVARGASGRGPRHRRASAGRGWSPDGRGRCPSAATAWRRRRGPRRGSWCSGCRRGRRPAGR